MGMTIDEAIKHYEDMKKGLYLVYPERLFDFTIDIMRKYQELEQEPTTKNDLGVDCIVDILGSYTDLDIPYKREIAEDILTKLSLVTPQEPRWIPMVRREPTDEEKAEYLVQNGEELCYMLENEMPLNGQEVLVSVGKFVSEDVFDEDFYNFENNDIEDVDAWMPLPKPYGEVEE